MSSLIIFSLAMEDDVTGSVHRDRVFHGGGGGGYGNMQRIGTGTDRHEIEEEEVAKEKELALAIFTSFAENGLVDDSRSVFASCKCFGNIKRGSFSCS
ncbi:hypothetical protein V6N12_062168 [Hibiscus sabdariffa]|uniref:Uncharacterized protein n=1 Tax=Hibiscus sabdariffa TaxID=183260 RepID=A0ABR2F829_9ROSI